MCSSDLAVFAPAGTPHEALGMLQQATARALRDEGFRREIESAGAEPFTLPASSCGFEVGVTFPTFNEFIKVLKTSDGSMTFLVTGPEFVTYTNLETGKSITENESGPGTLTEFPDGSVTLVAKGPDGTFLAPADAQRFGLPAVSVLAGAKTESVAPDGTITSLSLDGTVLVDVCAALR